MRPAMVVGILLIVAGLIALAIGGFSVTREREVLDVGPVEATAETEERVDIPLWLAGLAVGAGVVLIVAGRRRA